mmetsp:Transcript_4725/g.12637  ORF Transcript_4725/g.12637 Transcript_4725/m.12637 type:complete len:512 (+) Transcript_4725:1868-3403(+)
MPSPTTPSRPAASTATRTATTIRITATTARPGNGIARVWVGTSRGTSSASCSRALGRWTSRTRPRGSWRRRTRDTNRRGMRPARRFAPEVRCWSRRATTGAARPGTSGGLESRFAASTSPPRRNWCSSCTPRRPSRAWVPTYTATRLSSGPRRLSRGRTSRCWAPRACPSRAFRFRPYSNSRSCSAPTERCESREARSKCACGSRKKTTTRTRRRRVHRWSRAPSSPAPRGVYPRGWAATERPRGSAAAAPPPWKTRRVKRRTSRACHGARGGRCGTSAQGKASRTSPATGWCSASTRRGFYRPTSQSPASWAGSSPRRVNPWRPSLSSTRGWIHWPSRRGTTRGRGSRLGGGTTPPRTRCCNWRRLRRVRVSKGLSGTSCFRSSSTRRLGNLPNRRARRGTGSGRVVTSARCTPRAKARAAGLTCGKSSPGRRFPAPPCSSATSSPRAPTCPRTKPSRSTRMAHTTAARCTPPRLSAGCTRTDSRTPARPCARLCLIWLGSRFHPRCWPG